VTDASGDELMTVAEIAAVLKLNQQTIRNWIFSTAFGVRHCAVWALGTVCPRTVQRA
jgi:hypothetical protein